MVSMDTPIKVNCQLHTKQLNCIQVGLLHPRSLPPTFSSTTQTCMHWASGQQSMMWKLPQFCFLGLAVLLP